MAVKRRQKDDNHGTLEDKSQGPLVSDKRREMVHRGDTAQMRDRLYLSITFTFILICIRGFSWCIVKEEHLSQCLI